MNRFRTTIAGLVVGALVIAAAWYLLRGQIVPLFFRPPPTGVTPGVAGDNFAADRHPVEVIAENLAIPWEVAFLPGGDLLLTERPGRLRRLGGREESFEIDGVYHIGEGGLMGLELHPEFTDNRLLYLYLTYRRGGNIFNRVDRYFLPPEGGPERRETIIDEIPGARFHNGGRIKFGPDGYLYIATGDAMDPSLSQDVNSRAGKILRVTGSGGIPADNPFDNAVYSSGHRNPQGLAWDGAGRLWATEHGARGNDELNLIEKGRNYGWPEIEGDETAPDMETPARHSGPDTWAPGGVAAVDGRLFFAGLRGQSLYEAGIDPGSGEILYFRGHLREEYGRLRNVAAGPDGYLYLMTSNRDGRGYPAEEDDRLIRVPASLFD